MKIHWDSVAGWILGYVFVMIVGKLWLAPWMSWYDLLKFIVKSQIGWSW